MWLKKIMTFLGLDKKEQSQRRRRFLDDLQGKKVKVSSDVAKGTSVEVVDEEDGSIRKFIYIGGDKWSASDSRHPVTRSVMNTNDIERYLSWVCSTVDPTKRTRLLIVDYDKVVQFQPKKGQNNV